MMNTTEVIWQNGVFVPWAEAKTHVLSHTLHYGGGAFEGIRFYKTAQGPAIFRLEDHINRLFYSASALKMVLEYSKEEVIDAIKKVVAINKLDEGYIRPIAFYGYGKMGVNPIGNPVILAIACWPWGAYLPHESVDIKTSCYIRIHPDSTVVDAKLCGHYVNSILASLELQGTHYHEALFLDSSGYITEGSGENFFMVKNDVIYTPKLGGILSGITRNTIMQLASNIGFNVVEKNITVDEAYQAEEAFFTGTAAEVTAIRSINDKHLGQEAVGRITKLIKSEYMQLVQGKNSQFQDYLTYLTM
ncbi:branched-chain amino acid transaminase [Legionella saoudiensis]|uniref:branched-chain amino acid transaminase n=1 Tax=Legionella saoudiensis TaxID=1750561 RepID=UPI000730C63B|nr:branched-chain amino acid transaminase [Legionella saoudiensis]